MFAIIVPISFFLDDADHLRALHLPAGSLWLDGPYSSGDVGWGDMDFDSSFPDPPKMIHNLNDRGMNLLLWIANRCSGRLFEEGSAKGYLFPYKWPAADIRRPEVYHWFQEELSAYVRLGIMGYKIDRGEEFELPDAVQNENAILFPKLTAEGLAAVNGNDYFMFSRNANDIGLGDSIWRFRCAGHAGGVLRENRCCHSKRSKVAGRKRLSVRRSSKKADRRFRGRHPTHDSRRSQPVRV